MAEENQCTTLAVVTKDTALAVIPKSIAELKRAQLRQAIQNGEVSDPFTATILGSVLLANIVGAAGVAVVAAAASYGISRAMAPKSQMQQVGLMKGTVQLQNSTQGAFIPEIYGAAPLVTLVPGTASSWTSAVNMSTGANGVATKNAGANEVWNAGAVHGTSVTTTQDAFIRFVPNAFTGSSAVAVGFSLDDSPESGAGVGGSPALEMGVIVGTNITGVDANSNLILSHIFRPVIDNIGGPELGTWDSGDEFRVEKRGGSYHLYHNLAEVSSFTPPTPSATVYIAVSIWSTGSGLTTSYVQVGGNIGPRPSAGSGGCKVPGIITWAKRPQKHSQIVTTQSPGGKGHSSSTSVEQVYYTIDFAAKFCRGPVDLIREYANTDILMNFDPQLLGPTGVYDPNAAPPGVYDPNYPPDPIYGDPNPFLRNRGSLIEDPGDTGHGGGTGIIQHGASQGAVYPGNQTQLQDPTEEADVDAKNGPNSTSAGRGHSRIVHAALNLTRWQGLVPNFSAVWQHQTLKTLGPIYASLCSRIVDENGISLLSASDYDFSSIDTIIVRGMLIDGRRFTPAEIIDNEEVQDVYNYFTTEGDGKILAYENGDEPSITIPWEEIGWLNGGDDVPTVFEPFSTTLADETKLPRQVDLMSSNPGNDWDPDTQSAIRRVTAGNTMLSLQVALTLNPDEARQACDRRLLRAYIEGTTVKFTLTWTYLYIYAGYKITTTSPYGITYVLRLTSINGGIGVRDCEAVALETSAFSQSSVGVLAPIYNPSQPTPSVTVLAAMDIAAFRPADDGVFGMYFAGTPRDTSITAWKGFVLFIKRGTQWVQLDSFSAAATMGTVISATDLYLDPEVTDIVFTVNATTDVFTSVDHLLVNGAAVTPGNTGGSLPSPLVADTTYYVRDVSGDTFKLAATLGGAAINITTAGTGTNFLNSGVIVVDLYGTVATLSSITTADMIAGANQAVAGDMIFGYASAVRVAGYLNRWTLSKLRTNQSNSQPIGSLVDRNFTLLDAAVKFIALDPFTDLNTILKVKPVSLGASLADTGELSVICTGQSTRQNRVSDVLIAHDSGYDYAIRFIGHPRPGEIPADYAAEVWVSIDRLTPTNLKRTIPITIGTNRTALLFSTQQIWLDDDIIDKSGPGAVTQHLTKNNLIVGNSDQASAFTIEPLTQTWSRFDFGFQYIEVDRSISADDNSSPIMIAGLRPGVVPSPLSNWSATTCPLTVEWVVADALSTPVFAGSPGTVREIWRSFGVQIAYFDGIDPGFGVGTLPSSVGGDTSGYRSGPIYTFLLSGTQYNGYRNYVPNSGQRPQAIVAGPGAGFPFPLYLAMSIDTGSTLSKLAVTKIALAGDLLPGTIYAGREQLIDFPKTIGSVNASTDIITLNSHGYLSGQPLGFWNSGGALPAGLVEGFIYYVRDVTTNTFKVALSPGGVAVNITSAGTGTNYSGALQSPLYLRLYQKSRIPGIDQGFPLDIIVTP